MTIADIIHKEGLSVRSNNVCLHNGLTDLESIIHYYKTFLTFKNLRNCGNKSNDELISICKKYIHHDTNNHEELNEESEIIKIILTFNRYQREIVNSYIEITLNSFSKRSQNALVAHLKNNIKVKNLAYVFFSNVNYNTLEIKNIGRNSENELKLFLDLVKNFIIEVNMLKDEKSLLSLKNMFIIKKKI